MKGNYGVACIVIRFRWMLSMPCVQIVFVSLGLPMFCAAVSTPSRYCNEVSPIFWILHLTPLNFRLIRFVFVKLFTRNNFILNYLAIRKANLANYL